MKITIDPRFLTVTDLCALGETLCAIASRGDEAKRQEILKVLQMLIDIENGRTGKPEARPDAGNVVSLFGGRK